MGTVALAAARMGPTPVEALATAKQRRIAAAAALRRASEALARARDANAKAEAALAPYNDLDRRIDVAMAEKIKRGLDGTALPGNLVSACDERRVARERAAGCAGALRVLQAEHTAAGVARARAEVAVKVAAYGIVFDEAGAVAAEMDAAQRRVWELRDSLSGLAMLAEAAFVTLPPEDVVGIRGLLRGAIAVLHAHKPQLSPITEQQRAAVWRKRFEELAR